MQRRMRSLGIKPFGLVNQSCPRLVWANLAAIEVSVTTPSRSGALRYGSIESSCCYVALQYAIMSIAMPSSKLATFRQYVLWQILFIAK